MAALAEDPVVDAERDVSPIGQRLGVRLGLQVTSSLDELLLADRVAPAVGVVEQHGRRFPAARPRTRDVSRHGLETVQV
jgi:hypothetical protein